MTARRSWSGPDPMASLYGPTAPVLRYRGPGEAITQLLPELKAHKADLIDLLTHDTVLIDVCQGVESMTPTVLRSLLSREDLADIEVGRIPIQSLRPYVESFAEGISSGRIKLLSSADDRRHCRTCRNLTYGYWGRRRVFCAAYGHRVIDRPPRRCIEYRPLPDDPDQRTGWERWPTSP
jgi:hypothetical protein